MQTTRLFLHMGPGLHAGVERKLLSQEDQQTDFWDQPLDLDPHHAFRELAEQTAQKVESMYKNLGQPIDLVAHSFGGHISTQVLALNGHRVRSCRFVSTGYDIPRGFANLLRLLAAQPNSSIDFKKKARDLLAVEMQEPNLAKFWEVVSLIVTMPDFMRLYWPADSLYNSYLELAALFPPLNFSVFKNVLDDFLTNYFKKSPNLSWMGPVHFEIGSKDPLMVVESEMRDWKSLYPQATFSVRQQSGHFVHLEEKLVAQKR